MRKRKEEEEEEKEMDVAVIHYRFGETIGFRLPYTLAQTNTKFKDA